MIIIAEGLNYRVRSASINFSRAVYGMNWFNIAPGLSYIASNFDLRIVSLGIMTTSFYIGLAVFQMAGGILASRIGNVKTSVFGITVLGLSVIGTAQSHNLYDLIAARFFAGFGSAFFFSPALGLLHQIVPEQSYPFHVGLFNGSFNIGAGIGIIGWNILDIYLGWRTPLDIAGIIMLALALENFIVLRDIHVTPSSFRGATKNAGILLRKKNVWILPVMALSGILSETVVGNLLVYYLETQVGFSSESASILDMIFLFIGFAGGVIGGYIFARNRHQIAQFVAVIIMCSVLVILLGYSRSFIEILLEVSVLGMLTVNTLSILYTLSARNIKDPGMISFSLSFINFVQNIIGAFSPTIFGIFARVIGYSISWSLIGLMGLVGFVSFIFLDRSALLVTKETEITISEPD
jgi:predicted MFS family arabinose efflux permease